MCFKIDATNFSQFRARIHDLITYRRAIDRRFNSVGILARSVGNGIIGVIFGTLGIQDARHHLQLDDSFVVEMSRVGAIFTSIGPQSEMVVRANQMKKVWLTINPKRTSIARMIQRNARINARPILAASERKQCRREPMPILF